MPERCNSTIYLSCPLFPAASDSPGGPYIVPSTLMRLNGNIYTTTCDHRRLLFYALTHVSGGICRPTILHTWAIWMFALHGFIQIMVALVHTLTKTTVDGKSLHISVSVHKNCQSRLTLYFTMYQSNIAYWSFMCLLRHMTVRTYRPANNSLMISCMWPSSCKGGREEGVTD